MKKNLTIGIDTSNYTTSMAVFDTESLEIVANLKAPLDVKSGERGLRQSDALFAHVKNLPEISDRVREYYSYESLAAVGVSARPRDAQGSYMPCFLAGVAAAHTLASGGAMLFEFSHQAGHIAAALWHSGRRELIEREFIALHVSGGTTELLHVKPNDYSFDVSLLGGTLDINAGQLIDRVGVMMGLKFPCGPALELLAREFIESGNKCTLTQKVSVTNDGVNLSGAENKARAALDSGHSHGEVAQFILEFIAKSLDALTRLAKEKYGEMPVLYAGGVMSNTYIKDYLAKRHDAAFAPPEYSGDNAAGIALLAGLRFLKQRKA